MLYLDNASSTPIDPMVLEAMLPYLKDHFGNPSSTHTFGRVAKAALEKSRKIIADILNTSAQNIFFTSGGTEANNAVLQGLCQTKKIKNIISSNLEHKAVLYPCAYLAKLFNLNLHLVKHDESGSLDLDNLEDLLGKYPDALVSLMHANNEIGNLLAIKKVAELCQKYNAFFHSDTTQTVGHFKFDLKKLSGLNALVSAGHKFHGPKGIGFFYLKTSKTLSAHILGGGQERGLRSGTENVAGAVGLAKALSIADAHFEEHKKQIVDLKAETISRLKQELPNISFNGLSEDLENSLYTILNLSIPPEYETDILLFKLDIAGLAVAGGSACSSGAASQSHVIENLSSSENQSLRFSFSKYTTLQEVEEAIGILKKNLLK